MLNEFKICHSSEISSLMSISDDTLVTYSCGDQIIKVWKMSEDAAVCINEIKLRNKAISI